jgi:hypothetical protein
VIIIPAVSDEENARALPEGWKAIKPYLRLVTNRGSALMLQ